MRILFLTPGPPRPDGGGAAIRNWHLIQAARMAGHTVDIATFCAPRPPDIHICDDVAMWALPPMPRAMHERVAHIFVRRAPDLAYRFRSGSLSVEIGLHLHHAEREGDPYDVLQIEGLEMWGNLPEQHPDWIKRGVRYEHGSFAVASTSGSSPPPPRLPSLIYDAHNAESRLQERAVRQALETCELPSAAYSFVQWLKLRAYERDIMRKAAVTLAVSQSDAAVLERLSGRHVDVVPIGVDTARFNREAADRAPPVPFDVVFSGTLDYRPNMDAARWLLRDIWPRIRAAKPDATLALVGRNPTPTIQRFNGVDGITVTGEVPDDRPYLAGAGVYVLPIRFGAGVRVKLLNAMSMGCSVVATEMACEGVSAQHDTHLVITQAHPGAFAAATVALLDDPGRRARLGVAARALMVRDYDWSVVTPSLLAVYERIGAAHG